jgi:hypothetical protein
MIPRTSLLNPSSVELRTEDERVGSAKRLGALLAVGPSKVDHV